MRGAGSAAFGALPGVAAWRHRGARDGFEAVFARSTRMGWRFDGHTSAVEDGHAWTVRYSITVDRRWHTRTARLWSWSEAGRCQRTLRGDGAGRWDVDGDHVAALDGCLDVDLESSACTNTFPVHRLERRDGVAQDAPAVYVRVAKLRVERLEQRYTSRAGGVYDYEAPDLDFRCPLQYDEAGLVVDYPGIAIRVR